MLFSEWYLVHWSSFKKFVLYWVERERERDGLFAAPSHAPLGLLLRVAWLGMELSPWLGYQDDALADWATWPGQYIEDLMNWRFNSLNSIIYLFSNFLNIFLLICQMVFISGI